MHLIVHSNWRRLPKTDTAAFAFGGCWHVARKSLGWKGKQANFCKEVTNAAVKSAEAAAKEIGGAALESDALKDLGALAEDGRPVECLKKELWKKLEVQHIFERICEYV
jgi:hypothetical protein